MIVVATDDFEVYHGVVNELQERDVAFTSVEPSASLPAGTDVVVVGPDEPADVSADVSVVEADPADPRGSVEAALAALRGESGRTVVGVDPGERPGIAVWSGDTIVAAFQVPLADAPGVIRREIEGTDDPVVRVGDGSRRRGARIVDALDDVRVELVDETATTPSLGTGARGMGDVLAAANIARRPGEPVDSRTVEPTAGDIQRIKDRSREQGPDNRAIDDSLAHRVAVGDLTIAEALAAHRDSDSGE